jgi:hypothetical protein
MKYNLIKCVYIFFEHRVQSEVQTTSLSKLQINSLESEDIIMSEQVSHFEVNRTSDWNTKVQLAVAVV